LPNGDLLVFDNLDHTCALDLAERGGCTTGELAEMLGVTRTRICEIESNAVRKLKQAIEGPRTKAA
jgi:DNA-directed RNA polymerase sigma subunit (sigma70/sigma32)